MDFELFITSGYLLGECYNCHQPTTGKFDSDENRIEDLHNDKYEVTLECVNCHEKQKWQVDPNIFAEPT